MMLNTWCFLTLALSLNVLTKNDQTDKVFFWGATAGAHNIDHEKVI